METATITVLSTDPVINAVYKRVYADVRTLYFAACEGKPSAWERTNSELAAEAKQWMNKLDDATEGIETLVKEADRYMDQIAALYPEVLS